MEIIALFFAALAGWFLWGAWRKRRRRAISRRPLPDRWREILARNVPLYRGLPDELRAQLHGHIRLFLHDKTFTGFQGLEVTDEMRLTIAGNACILLLNRAHDQFSSFSSIYIYPDTFVAQHTHYDGLVRSTGRQARLGESWHRGPVVLSWRSALAGSRVVDDGRNVILHEFAHKLDGASGVVDGAPPLKRRAQYPDWARVMRREFETLKRQAAAGEPTVLDHYGATAPQEFFAVAVEAFYERPAALREHHPELYAQMRKAFRVDPLAWHEAIREPRAIA